MPGSELELVRWFQTHQAPHPQVKLGIGDDMAILELGGRTVLFAADMLLDGVHFDTAAHNYEDIGRKAVACNLSDCAAMAARPVAATVSVALPRGAEPDVGRRLWAGMAQMAEVFDLALAGGDTTSWPHPLAIDVAILAEPYPGVVPVTRSGAQPGDRLYVTGPLGGSLAGRHLAFTPRVHEARQLAEHFGPALHALMDISDGLGVDLHRLVEASGVGAELDEQLLQAVISPAAHAAGQADGRSALEHALGDGEDFELLLAVADGAEPPPTLPAMPVGRVTQQGFSLRRRTGDAEPLQPVGYQH